MKKNMTIEDKKLQTLLYKIKFDRPFYFENFLKIRTKKSELVPFKMNKAQRKFEEIIRQDEKKNKPKRYIILKARQLGFSTYCEGYIFHTTATNEYTNSLIIAHEDKATQNLFGMSKLFYDELPQSIRPLKKYSNEKAVVFENPTQDVEEKQRNPGLRSKITVATAGTPEAGRSGTINNLHISELAFFPNAEKTMLALLQCVPDEPNTFVALESTANGVGGYFYDMWQQAVAGKNDFTPIFIGWHWGEDYTKEFESQEEKEEFIKEVNQTYIDSSGKKVYTEEYLLKETLNLTYEQLNWRRWTINNKCGGDVDLFKQEYPSTPEEAFISSGRPVFNTKSLKQYELKCKPPLRTVFLNRKGKEVTAQEEPSGFLSIWKEPVSDKFYCIGADVAEGLEHGDYSDGVILDEQCDVVAVWHGHIDPDLFGKELVKIGLFYNEGYIGVERNNHGRTTLESIKNEEYWNLYYQKGYDKLNDMPTKNIGWLTTSKSKPIMIDKLAEYVREQYIGIPDKRIIEQMYTYVRDEKGHTNAQRGCYDDLVMALAIALQVFLDGKHEDYIPEKSDEEVEKKKEDFDRPEIIDRLFETEDEGVEYSM